MELKLTQVGQVTGQTTNGRRPHFSIMVKLAYFGYFQVEMYQLLV